MEMKFDAYYEMDKVYKCTLLELHEVSLQRGICEGYLLAYIRNVGARNVRFYMDKNVYSSRGKEHKILYRVCDEQDTGDYDFSNNSYNPMIEKDVYENHWYHRYKIGIIPVNKEDGSNILTFYVSDFTNLIDNGVIEIWEVE